MNSDGYSLSEMVYFGSAPSRLKKEEALRDLCQEFMMMMSGFRLLVLSEVECG